MRVSSLGFRVWDSEFRVCGSSKGLGLRGLLGFRA